MVFDRELIIIDFQLGHIIKFQRFKILTKIAFVIVPEYNPMAIKELLQAGNTTIIH
jgi:hypothetical protein